MLECNAQPVLQIDGAAAGLEWRGERVQACL